MTEELPSPESNVKNDETAAPPEQSVELGESTHRDTSTINCAAQSWDSEDTVFNGDFLTDIEEKYELMVDVLGEGSFGTVRKCRNRLTKQVCALKTIDKSKLPDATQLRREVDILLNVDHPHIIKLYDVYEDTKNIYLVSELCLGGELYDRVVEKTRSKEGHFSEFTAARIVKNILSAISYCHDVKKIVHRDLKPENFLLTDKTDDAQVKVIDFGLSRYSETRMKSCVGTIYYVAPEVLFGEYTDKADIWSIGVVAYVLLCGFPPFNAGSEFLTYDVVKEGNVKFPEKAWDKISPEAINFIKRLLDKDPDRRPSAAEALQDPWVTNERVNPFRKLWHGTFLPKHSPHARNVKKLIHSDQQRQGAFERRYSTKKIRQKKKTGFTKSLKSMLGQ